MPNTKTTSRSDRINVRINTANGQDDATEVTFAEVLSLIQAKLSGTTGYAGLFAIVEDTLVALSELSFEDRRHKLKGLKPLIITAAYRANPMAQSMVDRIDLINSYIERASW